MEYLKENIDGKKINMDYFAVGDIHGEIFKLKALMNRLHIKEDDELIFLGDYIDRGRYSFETIEYLIELDKKHKCIFIMGNHEWMFVNYLCGIHEKMFMQNGGFRTVLSYADHGINIEKKLNPRERILPEEHIKFFRKLKKYYETEEFIFTHAGIMPNVPLHGQPDEVLLWGREFSFINYRGKVVVYGHSPHKFVLNEKYKICIDTGACFDSMGTLTCVKLPERKFIQQSWVKEDLAGV